jgi:hypothetical protein
MLDELITISITIGQQERSIIEQAAKKKGTRGTSATVRLMINEWGEQNDIAARSPDEDKMASAPVTVSA